ncbi:MAG: sensor histidine kinase [Gemmatimonadaceae bacterium]
MTRDAITAASRGNAFGPPGHDASRAAFFRPLKMPTARWRRGPRAVLRSVLRASLRVKLIGAACFVVAAMLGLDLALHGSTAHDQMMMLRIGAGLLVMLAVNLVLVSLALRPVRDLEALSTRVLAGDLTARAALSPLADRTIAQLGRSINLLLDRLVSERSRMRRLAAEVIRTHDADRARVARELHESVAQDLAAQMLQLGAAAVEMPTPELRDRVLAIRTMAHDTMNSLRALSQTVYPEILDSLGLGPALSQLVRTAREHCAVTVDLAVDVGADTIPAAPAAVLYHVAQEALRNACMHAGAKRITISLTADARMAILTVADDGDGFEVATAESPAPGFGIFSMRERLALANGRLEMFSMPGQGTRVVAIIPLSTLEEL